MVGSKVAQRIRSFLQHNRRANAGERPTTADTDH